MAHLYDPEKAVLFLHVYLVNNWRAVSERLLRAAPHQTVIVHLCYDRSWPFTLFLARRFFKRFPNVREIVESVNNTASPEVAGFRKMLAKVSLSDYEVLTYMHAKGVTKPRNQNVRDWVELMRHFHTDRFDLIRDVFRQGYALYGVNLATYAKGAERYGPYQFSDFHYSGNFVSVNLEKLRNKLYSIPVDEGYFGLEGYWGKLTDVSGAYCAHISSLHIKNHYSERYPPALYR